jgi:hypothetical protein
MEYLSLERRRRTVKARKEGQLVQNSALEKRDSEKVKARKDKARKAKFNEMKSSASESVIEKNVLGEERHKRSDTLHKFLN